MKGKIADVRGLQPGQDAISPSRFPEWTEPSQIKDFADEVRDRTGVDRAGAIFTDNHYGWFDRVKRGHYELSPKGAEDVQRWRALVTSSTVSD